MDLDLYKGQILEFASSIPRVGRLDVPDASADAHSRLCGEPDHHRYQARWQRYRRLRARA